MSLISSTFVIAVHDEILLQTGVGRIGCHIEKLESDKNEEIVNVTNDTVIDNS